MRIAVIGASGWLGGTIAREAMSRGHEVTGIARGADRLSQLQGMTPRTADATKSDELVTAIEGHDVVVSAVTDRSGPERSVIPKVATALVEAVPRAGVARLAVMGGGGSLLNDDGGRFVDEPGFPEEYKTEALAQGEALAILRAAPTSLDWTYLSPPPHNLTNGEKRGGYAVRGDDHPVENDGGEASISGEDLASAMVDELERPQFSGRRFTAGYTS